MLLKYQNDVEDFAFKGDKMIKENEYLRNELDKKTK